MAGERRRNRARGREQHQQSTDHRATSDTGPRQTRTGVCIYTRHISDAGRASGPDWSRAGATAGGGRKQLEGARRGPLQCSAQLSRRRTTVTQHPLAAGSQSRAGVADVGSASRPAGAPAFLLCATRHTCLLLAPAIHPPGAA